jgi:hypothetical protein
MAISPTLKEKTMSENTAPQNDDITIEELDAAAGGVSVSTLTSAACPVSTLTSLLPAMPVTE